MSASSSADVTRPLRPRIAWWAEDVSTYLAWRPEWPVAVVTAAAWAALVRGVPGGQHHAATPTADPGAMTGMHHHAMTDMPGMGMTGGGMTGGGLTSAHVGTSGLLVGWALMCAAMMLPLALPAARHVAVNSFSPRRARALAVFVAAYLGVFIAPGLLLPLLDAALPGRDVHAGALVGLGLLLAAAWQVTAWKRWAVLSCSTTVPLPPAGLAADRACVEFGLRQGLRCLAACWPLMLLMAVLMVVSTTLSDTAVLVGMALATAMTVVESRSRRRRQLLPVLAAPLAAAGALAWVALA